jgi:hypothetical protein
LNIKGTAKPFVSIRISPDSPKCREVRLSRLQFEIAIIALPTAIIWGIISTTILVTNNNVLNGDIHVVSGKNISQPDVNDKKNPTDGTEDRAAMTAMIKNAAPKATSVPAPLVKDPVSNQPLGHASIQIHGRFAVDARILGNSDSGPFTLKITTTNLTQKLESGHFWVNIHAITKEGEDAWYSITQNMHIDADGRAETPANGLFFSFQYTKEQRLPLFGPSVEIERFGEMSIGFASEDGAQVVGKGKL